MPTVQTMIAMVTGLAGAGMLLLGARDKGKKHEIGNVWRMSALAKHTLGLVLLFFAILFFLSQFAIRRGGF